MWTASRPRRCSTTSLPRSRPSRSASARWSRRAFPEAIERVRPGWHLIGYDLPVRSKSVYFAYVAPENEHVHLGFEHGWAMADPHGLLQGTGITKQVRWLTFTREAQIDVERCLELIREAADVAAMTRGERVLRSMERSDDPD